MKKTLCLVIILSILASFFNIAFATEGDKDLENAILKAKEILHIADDEYVIENFRKSENGYELSWKSKDDSKNNWINATINDNEIMSYYKSINLDSSKLSITDMTAADAKKIADEFLLKASPTAFGESKYVDSKFNGYSGGIFNINYQRYENDIPVENQVISVEVSTKEKEITNFYTSFDKRIKFEDTNGIISFEDANKSFKDNFGYELKYIKRHDKDGKSLNAYLAYVPKSNFYNQYIDAKTGEVFKTDYSSLNTKFSATGSRNMVMAQKEEAVMDSAATLSKEEKVLSEEVANLPSKDKIISRIKNISELKIDNSYKEENFAIFKTLDGKYFANVEFSKNSGKDDINPYFFYKSIRYNLTDNKLISYYTNQNKYDANEKKSVDAKVCKNKSEAFIEKYYKYEKDFVKYQDKENDYSYYFERIYDGIGVKTEGITINFDEASGDVVYIDYNWSNTTFESKDNVKSIDEFYQTVVTDKVLKPMYITYTSYDEKGNRNNVLSTKLVYMLDDYSSNYSAITLKKLDYSGEALKEDGYNYTDIENHYVKEYAQKLAEIDIGLEGNELMPDENITKRDYLALVAKANDDWYEPLNDNWAKQYVRRGIIEDDKNLDEPVKRIDAVKYMINNLGYKEIAQKYEIYNCPFTDVSKEMKGYGALGAALNIVSDSTSVLNAEKFLTRADALIIIYNFLSRE
ncbi:MAG: hypothetical protein E7404_08300 [Ruminococcaceae bacterium]|nr:hypothetical protein [Oscillospiraceae bacterium]